MFLKYVVRYVCKICHCLHVHSVCAARMYAANLCFLRTFSQGNKNSRKHEFEFTFLYTIFIIIYVIFNKGLGIILMLNLKSYLEIKQELNNLWSYYNCNDRPNNEITNE